MASGRKNRSGKLIGLIIVAIVLAVACIVLALMLYRPNVEEAAAETAQPQTEALKEQAVETESTPEVFTDELQISFKDAQAQYNVPDIHQKVTELAVNVNPDIYAVVSIPGCSIEEPVCQRADDELYYTSHNEKGEDDENGCVFSQVFNTKDFTDNLTVLYGRNVGDGTKFTNLHYFEDPEFMSANPYIYVFTDTQVLIYEIFGAYKYDALHLIVGYDTNTEQGYNNYMVAISEIEPGMNDNFNSNIVLDPKDPMLTLSTGVTGDMDHRYLVQGMLRAKANIE